MKKTPWIGTLAMALLLTGCEMTVTHESSLTQPDTETTEEIRNSQADKTTESKAETPVPEENSTEESTPEADMFYRQDHPVQAYQKAYAALLRSTEPSEDPSYPEDYTAYIIHIDGDIIPELVVIQSLHAATVYSFDGADVYEVGLIGLDSYMYDFCYRPYLGMTSWGTGSVMYGDRHWVVQTFTNDENGRLQSGEEVHLDYPDIEMTEDTKMPEDMEMPEEDVTYLTDYEETVPYDIGFYDYCSYGESWVASEDCTPVTEAQIQYWLEN